MHKLQIVMMKRYVSDKYIDKINHIAPDAKITFFDLKKRHPNISKIRAFFQRILPFKLYQLISWRLDELSNEQKIIWIDSRFKDNDIATVLLFPATIALKAAKELVSLTSPNWIHSISAGLDRLPPITESTIITNSRGIHSLRIAEYVMSLIFALAKKLPEHISQNKKKVWKALPSKEIRGAKIGVVGLGSIGAEIAKIAKSCCMEVWATRQKIKPLDYVDRLFPSDDLPAMLKAVDYLVLAVPLTAKTYNLIGKLEFDVMKSTAWLINVSRGAVVDEDSLYYALKNNCIRGACIDVFQNERPLPKNSRFYKLPNILITSYSAYYSAESKEQILDLFLQNLERLIASKPLLNIAKKSQLTYKAEAGTL